MSTDVGHWIATAFSSYGFHFLSEAGARSQGGGYPSELGWPHTRLYAENEDESEEDVK